MAKDRPVAASVRRPQRQRTPTTLYTDDNPSTFTVKVKKTKAQREAEARATAAGAGAGAAAATSSSAAGAAAPVDDGKDKEQDKDKRPKYPPSSSLAPPNGRRQSTSPYFRKDAPISRRVTDTSDDLVSLSSRASSSSRRSNEDAPGAPNRRKRKLPSSSSSSSKSSQQLPAPPPPVSTAATVRRIIPISTTNLSTAKESPTSALPSPSPAKATHQASSPSSVASTEVADHRKRNGHAQGASELHRSPQSLTGECSPPPPARQAPSESVDISLGRSVPHPVRTSRALPPFQADVDKANRSDQLLQQQRHHMIYGKGLGVPTAMSPAEWTPMYSPDVFFDKDYAEPENDLDDDDSSSMHRAIIDRANGHEDSVHVLGPQSPRHQGSPYKGFKRKRKELHPNLLPVTRTVTCMATRKPNLDYLAVGDSAGFVLVYSLGAHIRPIARLESTACQLRSFEHQERARQQRGKFSHTRVVNSGTGPDDASLNGGTGANANANGASGNIILKKKPMRRLLIDTSETTIHAVGLVGTRVVLATSCELECMDIPSQTSLWVCPLMRDRLVTSLDIHTLSYDILVSCCLLTPSVKDDVVEAPAAVPDHPSMTMTSPLMLLTYSHNNVEICDANSPILVKSPCCTAIWDVSKTVENRLLFIAPDDQELELVLVQGGSIDNWKVACKTRIPIKTAAVPTTRLSQSEEGLFTLVASSRGIRLYQTETLQLVHTYGDQLALHGKSIVWQDCLLVGRRRYLIPETDNGSGSVHKVPQGNMLVFDDLLRTSVESSGKTGGEPTVNASCAAVKNNFADLGQFIIGVPHPTKGPEELCEALHIWRVDQATVVPALSIPLPKWSNGVQSLVVSRNDNLDEDRFVLTTQSGDCHVLLPKLVSSFAGHMYPVGSHLVRDNIEYIEDEDELDEVLQNESGVPSSPLRGFSRSPVGIRPEVLDDDLQEALRQSLLNEENGEQKESGKSEVINIVDSDDNDDSFTNIVIPCRPEAYLQQDVNRLRDDSTLGGRRICKSESSSDAGNFSNDFLGSMPQSKRVRKQRKAIAQRKAAQREEEKEKKPAVSDSNTFFKSNRMTIATITAVPPPINPCAVVPKGKSGKRSRSANLEAILRASIDPQLERFMAHCRQSWSNGSGSKFPPELLIDGSASDAPSSIKSTPEPKIVNGDLNDVSRPFALSGGSVTITIPAQSCEAVARNGATTLLATQANSPVVHIDCETPINISQGDNTYIAPMPVTGLLQSSFPAVNPSETLMPFSAQTTPGHTTSIVSVQPVNRADENAVVLGLLGLSPENGIYSKTSFLEGKKTADQAALDELPAKKSFELSLNIASSSDSSTVEIANAASDAVPKVFCSACHGRHVIHACGKRELPVDVEEILRVEREKREAEEEEKRKAKAEKRRQADAKRRETRRKKQQEKEERMRREQEKAVIEAGRQDRLAQVQAQLQVAGNMDPPPNRFTGYMQTNRFTTSLSSPTTEKLPPSYFDQGRATGHHFDEDYSSPAPRVTTAPPFSSPGWPETCAPVSESPVAHTYHDCGLGQHSEDVALSDAEEEDDRFSPSRYAQSEPTTRTVMAGTLSSAEGLAALASIAESTSSGFSFSSGRFTSPQPISFDEATNSHLDEEKKSATSLHGFGDSHRDSDTFTAGLQRAIPSYASIHSGSPAGSAGASPNRYWPPGANGYSSMSQPGDVSNSPRVASHHRS